jgi:excisionase family DNA binding protein
MCFMFPEQVDQAMGCPLGTAARMARRKELPYVRLPGGEIRFEWSAVAALLEYVPADRGARIEPAC